MRTCYAKCMGGCDQGLSNEHYLAEAILERLGTTHTLTNVAWLASRDSSVSLPASGLKAKVLCGRHNSELAHLDDVGILFCDALIDILKEDDTGGEQHRIILPGPALERWVLKVVVGAMASGTIRYNGERLNWSPSTPWVQVLFGHARPSGLGLCFIQQPMTPHRGHGLAPLTLEGVIVGAMFEFMGLGMAVMPDSIGRREIAEKDGAPESITPRPDGLLFNNRRGSWEILLDWGESRSGKMIRFEAIDR